MRSSLRACFRNITGESPQSARLTAGVRFTTGNDSIEWACIVNLERSEAAQDLHPGERVGVEHSRRLQDARRHDDRKVKSRRALVRPRQKAFWYRYCGYGLNDIKPPPRLAGKQLVAEHKKLTFLVSYLYYLLVQYTVNIFFHHKYLC